MLVPLLTVAMTACSGADGPQAEIAEWLDAAEAAAESGEFGTLADAVDENYTDARGNDQASLVAMLRRLGLGAGVRELVIDVETLDIHTGNAATLELDLTYASLPGDRLRLDAGRYAVTLELVRSDRGVWTVISSRWGRAGEALR